MQCKNPEPHEPHWHTVYLDRYKVHAGAGGWCKGEPYQEPEVPIEHQLAEAIRLTHEYIDPAGEMLPCIDGWSWWDALVAYDPQYANQYKEQVQRQWRMKHGQTFPGDVVTINPDNAASISPRIREIYEGAQVVEEWPDGE